VELFFRKALHGNAGLPLPGTRFDALKNAHELD
jgi:hypothetical protein